MNKFKGTGVAIVTPFNSDKSVDYKGLERLVEHLIANQINYLVVQGTTGESVTLTAQEKTKILALKKEHMISFAEITKKFKGKPEFKEKRKASNKKFSKALTEAFGKERALEISKAAKKDKKKKKKKE